MESKEDSVSLVGEAWNVAVRLKDVAVPGQVICTEATHRLFRGKVNCASLDKTLLAPSPGLGGEMGSASLPRPHPASVPPIPSTADAEPLQLFRVESIPGVKQARWSPRAAAELSPLTGRDHEVALLKAAAGSRLQEGMGQVVLLIGEPGLGKSRWSTR